MDGMGYIYVIQFGFLSIYLLKGSQPKRELPGLKGFQMVTESLVSLFLGHASCFPPVVLLKRNRWCKLCKKILVTSQTNQAPDCNSSQSLTIHMCLDSVMGVHVRNSNNFPRTSRQEKISKHLNGPLGCKDLQSKIIGFCWVPWVPLLLQTSNSESKPLHGFGSFFD